MTTNSENVLKALSAIATLSEVCVLDHEAFLVALDRARETPIRDLYIGAEREARATRAIAGAVLVGADFAGAAW